MFTIEFLIASWIAVFILGGFCGAGMVFVGILGSVEMERGGEDE